MSFKKNAITHLHVALISAILLCTGCDSENSDDSDTGYVQFYHGSTNAPAIYLTIDEDLDDDDDDEVEVTYTAVEYGVATSAKSLGDTDYFYELAWQDEDSDDRDDLEVITEGQISIEEDEIKFIVLSDDVTAPKTQVYNIEVIDDDNDDDEDLFNFRVLNLHPISSGIDIYISKSDETFNEASLIGQYSLDELSDNQKLEQDQYIFYITATGSETVLFQSDEIDYAYSSQYVMVVRQNTSTSASTFALDRVSTSRTIEYLDTNSPTQLRVYNAIVEHDLLENYTSQIDVYLNGYDEQAEIDGLMTGDMSQTLTQEKGDYSVDLTISSSDERILKNHLLTLPVGANKTVFFYLKEDNVDHDNDGDVDEDGDGLVDEIEISINSLVINNNESDSLYDHNIALVNLVDHDDFNTIKFYFVRSDETIESATNSLSVSYAASNSLNLLNNTYQVYAVAKQESSDVILSSFELILDESSTEQFVIIETDDESPTGFSIELINQNED